MKHLTINNLPSVLFCTVFLIQCKTTLMNRKRSKRLTELCTEGWEDVGDYCYLFVETINIKNTFLPYYRKCLDHSSSVAVFQNEDELMYFHEYTSTPLESAVIGYVHINGIPRADDVVSFYGKVLNWTSSLYGNRTPDFDNNNEWCNEVSWNGKIDDINCIADDILQITVCQQLQIPAASNKSEKRELSYVDCSPVCRSLTIDKRHRFTTSLVACQREEAVVENKTVAYTVPFYIPGFTGIITEVKTNEKTVMMYSAEGHQLSSNLSFALGSFFVFTKKLGSNMEAFTLMSKYSGSDIVDTIIVKNGSDEHIQLLISGFEEEDVFFMFTSTESDVCFINGVCAIFKQNQWILFVFFVILLYFL